MRNRVVGSPVRCSTNQRLPMPRAMAIPPSTAWPTHAISPMYDRTSSRRAAGRSGNRFGPCSGRRRGPGMVGGQLGAEVQALLQVGGAGGQFAARREPAPPGCAGAWPPAPSRPRAGRRTPGRGRRAAPAGRGRRRGPRSRRTRPGGRPRRSPGRPPTWRLRRRSSTSAPTSITGTTASRRAPVGYAHRLTLRRARRRPRAPAAVATSPMRVPGGGGVMWV